MQMIDKKKLLKWLLKNKTWRNWDDYYEVCEAIKSGKFDIKEETPQLKVGDKVRHNKHKYIATVVTVSKSGKTVRIKPEAMKYKTGNIPVECLTLIKEDTDHADRGEVDPI